MLLLRSSRSPLNFPIGAPPFRRVQWNKANCSNSSSMELKFIITLQELNAFLQVLVLFSLQNPPSTNSDRAVNRAMTAQKHLRELLSEDQEPFILHSYIANRRRFHLSRRNPARTHVGAVKNMNPTSSLSSNSKFTGNLCKSVCFSFPESLDPRRSPVLDFASPDKIPCRNPNPILLHVPTKTSALLLEAALRIQQNRGFTSAVKSKPIKRGLFGSILKRLSQRKRKIDIDRREKPKSELEKMASSFGCNGHSHRSSALWSESNGERSLGLEKSSTSGSDADAEFEESASVSDGREDWEFALLDGQLCRSPSRFSSGRRTPDLSPSAASSPIRHGKENTRDDYDVESRKKLDGSEGQQQDKEQCSPVSVLDPPFGNEASDVNDNHEDKYEFGHEDDGCDRYDCSNANLQRAKHKLLVKLYRFEKLAELDPIELEKRMLEQDSDDNDDYDDTIDGFKDEDETTVPQDQEMTAEQFAREVVKLRFGHMRKIPSDMRNLISDIIVEEWGKHDDSEHRESLMKRVCRRLESWKEVDSNTIDMMVEEDFRREIDGWKQIAQEQVVEIVFQIEVSIFGSLLSELFDM